MIFDGDGWRLSPAFDLVPNIGLNREHVLRIGYDSVVSNKEVLFREAKNFGIKQLAKADKIITAVFSEVSCWEKVFREFDVPDRDIQILGRNIEKRMARIKG